MKRNLVGSPFNTIGVVASKSSGNKLAPISHNRKEEYLAVPKQQRLSFGAMHSSHDSSNDLSANMQLSTMN